MLAARRSMARGIHGIRAKWKGTKMAKVFYHNHPKLGAKPLSMDERSAAMNIIAADGPVYAAANAAYQSVCTDIDERALARRDKPKVYEIHHEKMVAQDAFLREILLGGCLSMAANAARRAVSLAIEIDA